MPLPETLPKAVATRKSTVDKELDSINFSHGVTSWSQFVKASSLLLGSASESRNDDFTDHDSRDDHTKDTMQTPKRSNSRISNGSDSQNLSDARSETSDAALSAIYEPREIQERQSLPTSSPPGLFRGMLTASPVGRDPLKSAMVATPRRQRSFTKLWKRSSRVVNVSDSDSTLHAPHRSEAAIQTRTDRSPDAEDTISHVVNKDVMLFEEPSSGPPLAADKAVVAPLENLDRVDEATVETYENGGSVTSETTDMIRNRTSWFPFLDWAIDALDPLDNDRRLTPTSTTSQSGTDKWASKQQSQPKEAPPADGMSREAKAGSINNDHLHCDDLSELQETPIGVRDSRKKIPRFHSRMLHSIPSILPMPKSTCTKRVISDQQQHEQRERIINILKPDEKESIQGKSQSCPVVATRSIKKPHLSIKTKSILKHKGILHPRKGVPLETRYVTDDSLGENSVVLSDPFMISSSDLVQESSSDLVGESSSQRVKNSSSFPWQRTSSKACTSDNSVLAVAEPIIHARPAAVCTESRGKGWGGEEGATEKLDLEGRISRGTQTVTTKAVSWGPPQPIIEARPAAGHKDHDESGYYDFHDKNSLKALGRRNDFRMGDKKDLKSMVKKAERKIKSNRLLGIFTPRQTSRSTLQVTQQDLHLGKRKPWSMVEEKIMVRTMDKIVKERRKAVEADDQKSKTDDNAICACFCT